MAKTKIDDLAKGAQEMDAAEQKKAKGGLTAAQVAARRTTVEPRLAASSAAAPTLSADLEADRTISQEPLLKR